MPIDPSYVKFVEDQLNLIEFKTKKMFGGIGLFHEGIMFGMIANNVLRFKVDSSTEEEYKTLGMQPLMSKTKGKGMPYWQVPLHIIEDREQLEIFARKAINVAQNAKK